MHTAFNATVPHLSPPETGVRDGPLLGLEVVHETRYDYGAPVSLAHHLAHLQPLADAAQAVHAHTLEIEPAPTHRRAGLDAFGNARLDHRFSLEPGDLPRAGTGKSRIGFLQ